MGFMEFIDFINFNRFRIYYFISRGPPPIFNNFLQSGQCTVVSYLSYRIKVYVELRLTIHPVWLSLFYLRHLLQIVI